MHPSMWNPDDSDDDDPESRLPEGISQDQVNDLIRRMMGAAELIGLYADPLVQVERLTSPIAEGNDRLLLHVVFQIGQVAFTKRVQNPEQDQVDDTVRTIETGVSYDRSEEIKDKFRHDDDETAP